MKRAIRFLRTVVSDAWLRRLENFKDRARLRELRAEVQQARRRKEERLKDVTHELKRADIIADYVVTAKPLWQEEIDIHTDALIRDADKFFIWIPTEDFEWRTEHGAYVLRNESRVRLEAQIFNIRKERRESRMKIIVPILTAAASLLGVWLGSHLARK
ncbi:MAG: hypothetical protein JWO13_2272 [Acidobacteriales bacterium]|nr:hypothetical protein [Terriglobales bacterium]